MKIPVFVSTRDQRKLSEDQRSMYELILGQLTDMNLEPRTVGRSDYALESPLKEVLVLAKHCAGGLVLGFDEGDGVHTPWNQLEAGLMYSLGLPLLVFKEPAVKGGIFDIGSAGLFVQTLGKPQDISASMSMRDVFQTWRSRVQKTYYGE